MGVEEELEGINRTDLERARAHLAPLWTSHNDGSLRNGGVEFVTNGGLGGQQLYAAFERITHLLANVIEYQDTFRCSTHMHVNMLDFTLFQVAKFLMVYAACEPYLFAHCGQYRRSSNFCVPVGDSLPFHKNLIANLYEDACATRSGSRHSNKYTAMNLQPLFGSDRVRPIGTVEFRGGRPMTTMEDFLLQANLLLSIKEFVRRGPDDAEELLQLMGDTVTNSVYANGVAAGLAVPQVELEQATIDAWMLLKAYQAGMKRPRKATFAASAHSLPTEGFEWGTTRPLSADEGETLRQNAELSLAFWNSAVSSLPPNRYAGNRGNSGPDNIGNPYPGQWRGWDRFAGELENTQVGTRAFRDFLTHLMQDNQMGVDFSPQECFSLAIGWQLRGLEASPLHALKRAMTDKVQRGRQQSILNMKRFDAQPTLRLESMNLSGFNWRGVLPESVASQMAEWTGLWIFMDNNTRELDCFRLFSRIAQQKVRVKNRDAFRAALSPQLEEQPQVLAEMYSSELFHLFRIAGLNPVEYVHRLDLPLYDMTAKCMELLYAYGLAVPVCHNPRPGSWTPTQLDGLRITTLRNTGLGLGYNTANGGRERRDPRETFEIQGRTFNLY